MAASGWWHGTPHRGDADELGSQGNVEFWKRQGGGWRDMIGEPQARLVGPGNPSWNQLGASIFYGYRFALNDSLQFTYHLQHDFSPSAPGMYMHVHWVSAGADVNPVAWEFSWIFARGFNQQNFAILAPSVASVQEAPPASAYRHMTSEIAAPINPGNFEVDGLLIVSVKRITNGGVDNAANITLLTSDVHYQCNTVATRQRVPPFY